MISLYKPLEKGSRRRRDCGAEGPGRPRRGREADRREACVQKILNRCREKKLGFSTQLCF